MSPADLDRASRAFERLRPKLAVAARNAMIPAQDVEDVIQETWMRVARRFDPDRSSLATYAYTLLFGEILRYRRDNAPYSRNGVLKPILSSYDDPAVEHEARRMGREDELYAYAETVLNLVPLFAVLTENETRVLLALSDGSTLAEAAEATRLSITRVFQLRAAYRRKAVALEIVPRVRNF